MLLLLPVGGTAAAAPVSFEKDLVPVLRTRCATCHLTGKEAGNIALHPGAAYDNLVGVKASEADMLRVSPGKPGQSYLMLKLEGNHLAQGGKGVRMPLGAAPLDAATLGKFRAWIVAGAPRN